MGIKRFSNLSAPARVATLASVAAVAVWSAVWITPSVDDDFAAEDLPEAEDMRAQNDAPASAAQDTRSAPHEAPASVTQDIPGAQQGAAERAPSSTADVKSQPAAPAPANTPQPDARATLREALASDNAGLRIDALRTLAELRRVDVLPELLTLDASRDPELAPTVFQVTGRLAQLAEPSQRTAAVSQLSRWLESERAREGADARGNVSVLVETLADFQAPEAERSLIAVLQSDDQPLHVKTLAVEGLAKLSSPESQAALTQFRAQLGATERQGFEAELQREAEQATDRALARLAR